MSVFRLARATRQSIVGDAAFSCRLISASNTDGDTDADEAEVGEFEGSKLAPWSSSESLLKPVDDDDDVAGANRDNNAEAWPKVPTSSSGRIVAI